MLENAIRNALAGMTLTTEDREAFNAMLKQRVPEDAAGPERSLIDECEMIIWG